jgi:predicted DNA-binding protein
MALSLPDDVRDALDDLADATEKPASTLVSELLQEMLPQLEGMAKVARALKAGKHSAAKTAMRHMLGDTLAHLMIEQQPDMFKGKARKGVKV